MYRARKNVHLIHSKKDEFECVHSLIACCPAAVSNFIDISAAVLKQLQVVYDKEGRGPASVQEIEKGGHMVCIVVATADSVCLTCSFQFVQTMPAETAQAVYNALSTIKVTILQFRSIPPQC